MFEKQPKNCCMLIETGIMLYQRLVQELQISVYLTLTVLVEEKDIKMFHTLMERAIKQ